MLGTGIWAIWRRVWQAEQDVGFLVGKVAVLEGKIQRLEEAWVASRSSAGSTS